MEIVVEKPAEAKKIPGAHSTYWLDTKKTLPFPKLKQNLQTEVVIIGGGIAGITAAYCLSRAGKKVVLLEDGEIGGGETGRTTAQLVTALDERYFTLEKRFGKRKTRFIAQSHVKAINFVEKTIRSENIDCDFERLDGFLFLHPTDKKETIEKELEAAIAAGLEVTKLENIPGIKTDHGPCIRFSKQAQIHPLKYLNGLCFSILEREGQLFTNTHVAEIDKTGIITDEGFVVTADHVVMATYSPIKIKYGLNLKQNAYRSYVIGAKIKRGDIPDIPKALWWDTGDQEIKSSAVAPYHYVRIQKLDDENDLLIVGGEDHSTGMVTDKNIPETKRYDLLEKWVRERFPVKDVPYKWSGQIMEPVDGLAFIGKISMEHKSVFVATGFSGNGMTYGTMAGMLITDLINGKKNRLEDIYSPSRFNLIRAGKIFIEKIVEQFKAYMNPKLKDKDTEDWLEKIQPLEGKVVVMGGIKYGVYRDDKNFLHLVSTECTHLQCTVKWNPDEKSWDCPCHGSRFSYKGKVINGPANISLHYHKINGSDIFRACALNKS
jgi:glycine/D-amino acid oxidase-like deaminating enzyme/nitrite reductase/ring-hydroxylating ferredoxin subunit